MTSLWLDLRYALRTMAKAPGLTAVLVITLALGIGATTTIFSVVNSVILRPLPYREPDRLARLYTEITGKVGLPRVGLSTLQVRDLRHDCRTCAAVAAWRDASASLAGGDRPGARPCDLCDPRAVAAARRPAGAGPLVRRAGRRGGQPELRRKDFRGREPIGQRIKLLFGYQRELSVVGVFADIKREAVDKPAGTELMTPLQQYPRLFEQPVALREMFAVLRTTDEPAALIPAVHRAVAELDPTLPLFHVHTMDDVLWEAVARPRFLMFLLTAFAGIALLLAAIGIYGVISFTVAQRSRELGIRVALGATKGRVLAQILGEGLTLTLGGVVIGLAAAFGLTRLISTMLFGVAPLDAATFAGVAVALTGVAVLASLIPARRAAAVDPVIAMRAE
jgi:FtsX-like permease family